MPVKIKKTKDKAPKKHNGAGPPPDWDAIKGDFMRQNLDKEGPGRYSLKQIAKDWNVSHGALKKRAMAEGPGNEGKTWEQQMREERRQIADSTTEMMRRDLTFNEYEIRQRHVITSRVAMNKGIQKIQNLKLEDLTVRDAIRLINLGLTHERIAAGLPDDMPFLGDMDPNTDYETREQRVLRQNAQREFGKRVIQWKREDLVRQHGEMIDVTPDEEKS
jgi:hypothetical protein